LAILATPNENVIVKTAGNPSGTMATAKATANKNDEKYIPVCSIDSTRTTVDAAMPIYPIVLDKFSSFFCNGVLYSFTSVIVLAIFQNCVCMPVCVT